MNSNYLIPGDSDYMGLPGDYDYMDEYNNNMDEITDEIRDNFISHCISSIKDKTLTTIVRIEIYLNISKPVYSH